MVNFVDKDQFQNSALILVDFQQRWTQHEEIKNAFPNLQENVNKLTSFARDKRMEIIHVYVEINPKDYRWCQYTLNLMKSTDDEIYLLKRNKADLNYSNPKEYDEKVIIKPMFGAFWKTELNKYLKSKNISSVYVSGLVTSICILNTIMGAMHHGYDAYIVEDCCADISKHIHDTIIHAYWGVIKPVKISNNLKRDKEMICKL